MKLENPEIIPKIAEMLPDNITGADIYSLIN